MKLSTVTAVGLLVGFAGLVMAQALKGPVSDAPFTEKWWPSKWGAEDRAGSANHTKNSANIKRPGDGQAVQVHHHRQVLPPRGAGLRRHQLSIPGTPTGRSAERHGVPR
jgi:hypothetical protein